MDNIFLKDQKPETLDSFLSYSDYTEVETMPKLSLKHRRHQGFLLNISA